MDENEKSNAIESGSVVTDDHSECASITMIQYDMMNPTEVLSSHTIVYSEEQTFGNNIWLPDYEEPNESNQSNKN